MDNLETQEIQETENRNELVLELQAEVFLREGRKWAKFLAILGFIFVGLGAFFALLMFIGVGFSSFANTSGAPVAAAGFVYLIVLAIYFFPIYALLQFSNKAKEALDTRNSQSLTKSMKYLKMHYKFIGIMSIVMFALYPIIAIVAFAFTLNKTM